MKKSLLASALFLGIASTANAGFLDSLLGGGKEEAKASEETAKETTMAPVDSKAAMVDTAITLLPMLTNQLNVSEEQAQGGVGSLMNFAKGALSNDEFSQLSAGVPNMDSLLAAAPTVENSDAGKAVSGLLAKVGGDSAKTAGLDMLNQQFEALGLNPDMIAQFAELIMSYFSGQESDTAALLQKGLGSLLG